jgi:hypothetical protein
MRIQLRRAAGQVEAADAGAGGDEIEHRIDGFGVISSVRFGPALTWQCRQLWLQR